MTLVVIHEGKLINVGEWDYSYEVENIPGNPWTGEDEAPEGWDYDYSEIIMIRNPLPDGAEFQDREIAESDKGRILLADDWVNLREDAYPPMAEQMDAFWKGGEAAEAMRVRIQAVKDRYPKPQ